MIFNVEVEYTLRCIECERVSKSSVVWPGGMDLPLPAKPSGWTVLNYSLICDRHTLEVQTLQRKTITKKKARRGRR